MNARGSVPKLGRVVGILVIEPAEWRKTISYVFFLVVATVVAWLLSRLQLELIYSLDSLGIGQMDFSHPLVWVRSGLGFFRSWLYLPIVFWLIAWFRYRYTDSMKFKENWMGVVSIVAGAIMLAASQTLPVILDSDVHWLAGASMATYGMGLCLCLSAILTLPACRTFLLARSLGFASFAIGLLWITLGVFQVDVAINSVLWPVTYVLSLVLVVLGLLGVDKLGRWFAFSGLILLAISALGVAPKFRFVGLIMDWRYRTPVDFLTWLAWSIAFAWGVGIFGRIGHPFDSQTKVL